MPHRASKRPTRESQARSAVMNLSGGRTDSPNAFGWKSDSSPRQTHFHNNDKTIISPATEIDPEAKAKLRKINKPMKSGTPTTSSPNRAPVPRDRLDRRFGRAGSLSVFGQKRYGALRDIVVSRSTIRSRFYRRGTNDEVLRIVHPSPREGRERELDTQDRGYGDRSIRQQPSRAMTPIHGNR